MTVKIEDPWVEPVLRAVQFNVEIGKICEAWLAEYEKARINRASK